MKFVFYFYSSPEGYVVMKTAVIDQRKERKPQGLQGEGDDKWYKAICDQAGVMIVVCNNDGAIQYFNKAAEEILQYSREEVLYKHTPLIFHSATELKNRAEELSQQGYHIKTGFELLCLYGQLNSQTEWLYVNKAGEQFPVLCTIRCGSGGVGHNDDYIITSVDITSRERQKEELIASLTKEKEQNESKSKFVSIASHEFRTPLSSILSSVYLLSKYTGSEEQPQRDKHIGRIISSVSLLTETLNDFLSLSKIEEGNIKVQINQYDIRQQITEIISELQHLFKKEQHILYEHEGPSTNASLDISLMKHVITNLLSNALKFSQGIVEVLPIYNNAQLTISVKDYGIGIPEEDQQHLFQRFFRSSNAAHIQGTGLGLNIVKKYVELMGGNIACMSKQGEGTTFILSFNGQ